MTNTARFAFLDPRATEFYLDWERTAKDVVGILRVEAGRNPYDDRGLTDLTGELSTRSETFRTCWAAHNVASTAPGPSRHPAVGDLDLTYEGLESPSDPGLTLLVYTAEPHTPTQDALQLLASQPDRPARRFAYQALLIEEFARAGTERVKHFETRSSTRF